jgi:hypothetical protein
MFEVWPIIRNNPSPCLGELLNNPLLRDLFPYRLPRGIHLKEGVL